ncbi:MAG TPA: hypothetical protein VIY73_23660 [Polyangiaceae bacterium]
MADPKQPTTAPPPFDPEAFAKDSETNLRVGSGASSDSRRTTQILPPPPLNKRVRLAVPIEDLEWFELSAEARGLLERLDGKHTLLEIMEGNPSPTLLKAIAELHDARLLAFEG